MVQTQESQGLVHIVDEKNGQEGAVGPVVETLDSACEERWGQQGQLPYSLGSSSQQPKGGKDM